MMAENQVKVSQDDNVPNWLASKLQGGYGVVLTNNGTCLRIDCSGTGPNGMVAVDSQDRNLGFLSSKISSGTGISIANTGSALEISANTQTGDHKVSVDSADPSPDYLEEKIKAGPNVSITNQGTYLEISSTDTGMLNPMTAKGDLISGGVSGNPIRLPVGNAGEVLTSTGSDVAWVAPEYKVKVWPTDTVPDYLGNKFVQGTGISISSSQYDLTIGLNTTGANAGQVLTYDGNGTSWKTLPRRTDWSIETALLNGTFNQTLDRTFYVEIFPECEFFDIDSVVAVLRNANSGDEWRAAVYDNNRNMIYYGTSTGTNANYRKITLTKLADFSFNTDNVYFLALSQHTAGSSSSQIATATVTSPFYCWYEDHVLESGRAMPANASLTAVSGKVPAIGLRGR